MVSLSQESPLQLTWGYRFLTICPGTNIVILFVRRRIQPLVFSDESYLVVLRRSGVQHILHLYALNWSMPVVYGTHTRSVTLAR